MFLMFVKAKKQKADQKELDEYEDVEALNLARLTVNEDSKAMASNLVSMKEAWTTFPSDHFGESSLIYVFDEHSTFVLYTKRQKEYFSVGKFYQISRHIFTYNRTSIIPKISTIRNELSKNNIESR